MTLSQTFSPIAVHKSLFMFVVKIT